MSEAQDDSQKTEDPTQKRLDDAIKKGRVAFSREVNSFILLLFLTLFIIWMLPPLLISATAKLSPYIYYPHLIEIYNEGGDMIVLVKSILKDLFLLAVMPLLISFIGAISGNFLQNKLIFSPEAIKPDLSKLSPLQGLKKMFSMKSIVEFLKGLLKVALVGAAAYITIKPELPILKVLHTYDYISMMQTIAYMVTKVMITICVIMGIIAGADFIYQKYEYTKELKMSKQEIKDEHKQSEGDPEIKAKLKAIRQEKAKQRMMSAVPQADVVITNPTHFAIALEYKPPKMQAPIVVAKGQDNVALKIREIAREHRVPVVENPPLARALYKSTDLEESIPYEHYKAVAEVIAYVMKLKHGKR